VITLVVLTVLKVESPSRMLVLSVAGISIGTLIAVASEVQFDTFGFVIHEVSAVAGKNRRFHPSVTLAYCEPLLWRLQYLHSCGACNICTRVALAIFALVWRLDDLHSCGACLLVVALACFRLVLSSNTLWRLITRCGACMLQARS
jgi:hypothetical protein